MKKAIGKIARFLSSLLAVLSICIMLFTVVSVLTFNRSDRELF